MQVTCVCMACFRCMQVFFFFFGLRRGSLKNALLSAVGIVGVDGLMSGGKVRGGVIAGYDPNGWNIAKWATEDVNWMSARCCMHDCRRRGGPV
jgi:hypothetical protein